MRHSKRKLLFAESSNSKEKYNTKIFFVTILLVFLGLIAVADASAPTALQRFSDKFYYLKAQSVWATVGLILMFVFSKINYKFLEKIAAPFFYLSLIGLILVFVPGLGIKIMGAKRWVDLGVTTIQPSEFAKLSLALYLAKLASMNKKTLSYFVALGSCVLLIMLEPDLGTTLVITSMAFSQIFISGINLIQLFLVSSFGGVLAFLLIITSSYRRDRLMTFLKLAEDPLNKGYHLRQILLALGSGGLFGVGLGDSRQKYLFLPETATDSIFAVIAEEVGFIGASALIILFVLYIYQGISIARNAPDRFSAVLATGIVSWIGFQTFLNIGSMVSLVPLTGIPLPFISTGGSSLVTMLIGTGILMNISKYAKKEIISSK
jgi:cell division protein FtsW